MMIPAQRLYDTIDGTWPAARYVTDGPWLLRDGQGGGKRVSAASARAPVTADDIPSAVAGLAAHLDAGDGTKAPARQGRSRNLAAGRRNLRQRRRSR